MIFYLEGYGTNYASYSLLLASAYYREGDR